MPLFTHQIQSQSSSRSSPWKSHPIYKLRRCLICNAIIGVILCAIAMSFSDSYSFGLWVTCLVGLALSGVLALVDLALWAADKKGSGDKGQDMRCRDCLKRLNVNANLVHEPNLIASDPTDSTPLLQSNFRASDDDDGKPMWPKTWVLVLDFVFGLGGIYFWLMVASFVDYPGYGYHSGSVIKTYATIPLAVAGIVHFKSWWAALMARKKTAWEKEARRNRPNEERQNLLPTVEPQSQGQHCQNSFAPGLLQSQNLYTDDPQGCRDTQAHNSLSPLRWLTGKARSSRSIDAHLNKKAPVTLTPSITPSSPASERLRSANDIDDEAQYAGSSVDTYRGRISNRSTLLDRSDIIDEEDGNDTPGAGGMDDDAAVVVKKKAKKQLQAGSSNGKKKMKGKQVEVEDEA